MKSTMSEKRRQYAKSVIMKGLESDYSSYNSDVEEIYPIPRTPSIQFEDYNSEDEVQFIGIRSTQRPVHLLLQSWDQLYPK